MAIRKLHNGKYRVDIWDVNNTRQRQVFTKKEEARAFEAYIEKEKYEQRLIHAGLKKQRYLFNTALEDFERTKLGLRSKSIQKYSAVIKQFRIFAEVLNIRYVDEFTPDHGSMFYDALLTEREVDKGNHIQKLKAAPKTVNFYLQTLKAFFYNEVLKDHILKSPVLHLKALPNEKKRPEPYTLEETKKFFAQEMPLKYKQYFLALFFSGMRYNEASNLAWEHIDFNNKLIHIMPTATNDLKTQESERVIPMSEGLFTLINEIAKDRKSNFVFVNSKGTKIKERTALTICKKYALKAGISTNANLKKFRTTFASFLIQNKVTLEAIKELLGHTSIITTEKYYAKNDANKLHTEVEILDGMI